MTGHQQEIMIEHQLEHHQGMKMSTEGETTTMKTGTTTDILPEKDLLYLGLHQEEPQLVDLHHRVLQLPEEGLHQGHQVQEDHHQEVHVPDHHYPRHQEQDLHC